MKGVGKMKRVRKMKGVGQNKRRSQKKCQELDKMSEDRKILQMSTPRNGKCGR